MSGTSRENEFLLDAAARRREATAGDFVVAGAAATTATTSTTTAGIDDDLDDHQTIIDVVGGEVTNVVFPVAACIAITSALVQLLDPDGSTGNLGAGTWASAAYKEKPTDSDATKALGAFENAAVFVAFIATITFLLVLAFKHGATRLIKLYMALSGFSIFAVLWGLLSLEVVATLRLPLDAVTYSVTLWNFAAVGTAALFVLEGGNSRLFPARAPLALRQGYLVAVGVATAFAFASSIPEWTTWALLIGMACYDLWAVLHPTGPLKLLLDAAQERDEDIPALIYEAGPSASSRNRRGGGNNSGGRSGGSGGNGGSGVALGSAAARGERGAAAAPGLPLGVAATSSALIFSSLSMALGTMARRSGGGGEGGGRGQRRRRSNNGDGGGEGRAEEGGEGSTAPAPSSEPAPSGGPTEPLLVPERSGEQQQQQQQEQRQHQHLRRQRQRGAGNNQNPSASDADADADDSDEDEHDNFFFPRDHADSGIKLGMGDFIFYSVLVGRASMYDGMAALAAAAAVIAGLGATLLLLALQRSALPALPISIALGAICTAAARFCLEPVVMPLAGSMLFF